MAIRYVLFHGQDVDGGAVRVEIAGGPQVFGRPCPLQTGCDQVTCSCDLLVVMNTVHHYAELVEVVLCVVVCGPALVPRRILR